MNMQIKTPDYSSISPEQLKYEPDIRALLKLYMSDPSARIDSIDCSAPRVADMGNISKGTYVIKNFGVTPGSIRFYVGDTEVHIMRKAAEAVFNNTVEEYLESLNPKK